MLEDVAVPTVVQLDFFPAHVESTRNYRKVVVKVQNKDEEDFWRDSQYQHHATSVAHADARTRSTPYEISTVETCLDSGTACGDGKMFPR